MLILTFFFLAELSRTSGFIDIPTAPAYDMPGTFSIGFKYSMPIFNEDPDLTDAMEVDPNDIDVVLKYGFSRAEIALSMFTPNTFTMSAKFLAIQEEKYIPAVFIGVDDISYSKYISTIGRGIDVGFLEEKGYYLEGGGRPPELLSGYIALQKSIPPYFNFVFGLGRGRFVGYGNRSHIFNSDIIVIGEEYIVEEHSPWAFGIFVGGSIRFPFGLEFITEMDGRDANAGMKYHHKYFTASFAITKIEHFINSDRPFSPRLTAGVEFNNRFMTEKPRFGSIECIIQDITTKQLLHNATVEIKELNKKYAATGGSFKASLSVGNYTIFVTKPDYVDYTAKISVKSGMRSKLVFNLKKTEEAMRKDAALREKEESVRTYLAQGKTYFFENKLDPARIAFEMVLSLDPDNTEAKECLGQIEPKRAELIATYAAEAKTRGQTNDFAKAIEYWQKVLSLDPNNREAKAAIADLQIRIAAAKKPEKPTQPPSKPTITKTEIEALFNKGVALFTAEKYDEALKIFKQVLVYDPNHIGAKDYKSRTEVRLKVLGGG